MVAHYTVVQYVPDPVIDERINIGVIVYGEGRLRCQFLEDWRRVERFGGPEIGFLKDFARTVRGEMGPTSQLALEEEQQPLSEESLRRIVGHWKNSIQFTPPRASLQSQDALLQDIARRFLVKPAKTRQKRQYRDKRTAVSIAARSVREALVSRIGKERADRYFQRGPQVKGEVEEHRLDLGVQNGHLLAGAYGISLESPRIEHEESQVTECAWAISDIRRAHEELPLAVIALLPKRPNKLSRRARRVFDALHAQLVTEHNVDGWADSIAIRAEQSAKAEEDSIA